MLHLPAKLHQEMIGHCLDHYPLEACGLLAGPATSSGELDAKSATTADRAQAVEVCYRMANGAASARVYSLDPLEHLRTERDAGKRGLEIIGVFHSHTHTDAYPSPTDVAEAPDPAWHYVLVSLRDIVPVVRSYLIVDGKIEEEEVVLE